MSHKVIKIRHLTDTTYVVRCSRGSLKFAPGQHLSVGPENDLNMREYSVYSGIDEDFIEILIKEVKNGSVSKQLKILKPHNNIKIEGPFGSFIIEESEFDKPLYFIATGTGISPYHCFALSYPQLPFTVLHGVRTIADLYEYQTFMHSHIKFIPCISTHMSKGEVSSHKQNFTHLFTGRVTHYLKKHTIDPNGIYFLCGNCDMIYEVFDILVTHGVMQEHIKAEVYF